MARRRVIVGLFLVGSAAMLALIAISPRAGAGWTNPRDEVVFGPMPLTREHLMDGLTAVAILCWVIAAGVSWRAWSRRRTSPRQ